MMWRAFLGIAFLRVYHEMLSMQARHFRKSLHSNYGADHACDRSDSSHGKLWDHNYASCNAVSRLIRLTISHDAGDLYLNAIIFVLWELNCLCIRSTLCDQIGLREYLCAFFVQYTKFITYITGNLLPRKAIYESERKS